MSDVTPRTMEGLETVSTRQMSPRGNAMDLNSAPHHNDLVVRGWRHIYHRLLGRPLKPYRANNQLRQEAMRQSIVSNAVRPDVVSKSVGRLEQMVTSRLVIKYTAIISSLIVGTVVLLGLFYFAQFRELVLETDTATREIVQYKLQERDQLHGMALAANAQDYFSEALYERDIAMLRQNASVFRNNHRLSRLQIYDATGDMVSLNGLQALLRPSSHHVHVEAVAEPRESGRFL